MHKVLCNSLCTVSIVSLHQHDFLSDIFALLDSAETNFGPDARVRLFVSVSNTHTTTNGNIKALQLPIITNNRDESDIVRKDINIVDRRYGDCDFELGLIL